MSWNTRRAILLLLMVLGCSGLVFAASQNAVIYGTVYNLSSNPMPDVTVVLENKALGITRTAVTGSDGSYTFTEVPPADNYSVTAKQGGRTLDTRSGVTVNVGDERVILPPLTEQPAVAAGTGGEVKPVKPRGGATPTVRNETISTTISGVVTGDQLRALPLYNRNFLVLGLITPNVHDTEPGSALAGASFSVAGARPSQNSFLLDGAENIATSSNQAIPFQVNDSIQEFRVTSSTANAEYGRSMGGTVNVVTKRASNSFHGSVYGFFGADSLNADNPLSVYNNTTFNKAAAFAGGPGAAAITKADLSNPQAQQAYTPFSYNQYVANAKAAGYCTNSITPGYLLAGAADNCVASGAGANTLFDPNKILAASNQFKQPFQSEQFGASAGGALVKDKWFVFGSYEGTRIDNPNPILERVPSSFDKTYDPNGTGVFAFSATDPNYVLGQKILGLFPASNIKALGSGAVPGVLEFFQGEAPNYTHVHNFLFRTDYVKSDKTNISLRYVAQFLNQLHDDSLPQGGAYPGNGALRQAVNQNATLALTHSFSPKVINETRFSYDRFDLGESAQDASFNATSIGLPFKQMPTILLNGIDPQSSGAMPTLGAVLPVNANDTPGLGASGSWLDVGGCTALPCTANGTMFPWSDGRFPMARLGAPLGAPSERRDSTFSVGDNLSWSHNLHSFKFGLEFRHLDNDLYNGALARGLIYSGNIGEFTSDANTCNFDVNVFGGCAGQAFFAPSFDFAQFNPQYSGKFSSYVLAGYFQDSYRVHKRVTINYGLRYEYFSVPHEINNSIYNFDPLSNGLVRQGGSTILDPYGNVCGAANPDVAVLSGFYSGVQVTNWSSGNGCNPVAQGSYNQIARSNKRNLAPRLGVAWNVRGDEVAHPTVLRFGAGLFYDQMPINAVSTMLYNQPMKSPNVQLGQVFSGIDGFDFGGAFGVCGFNGFSGINYYQCGLGNQIVNPAYQNSTSLDGVNPYSLYSAIRQPSAVYARDTVHSGTPYSFQVSLSAQQQITSKMTLEVGYVGLFSDKLPAIYDSNYANEWGHVRDPVVACCSPDSNAFYDNVSNVPVYTMTNQANANYHELMVRLRTSGWHGLRFNVNYDYSRSMDNSSTGIFPNLPIGPRGLLLANGYFENASYPAATLLLGNALGSLPAASLLSVPVFPSIDFGAGALTTTGAGQVLVSPYVIPQDPFNWQTNDYGRSDFDSTHRVTVDYVWETKSSSKLWDMWSFSGVFTAQSGQPFSIFGGPIAGAINQRAELGVPTGQVAISSDPNHAIDPSQFIFLLNNICPVGLPSNEASTFMPVPGQACTGRSARNGFIGPNLINMNFAVQKGFNIGGESKKLYLRAEFFNLFDRANYYNPISSISDNGITPSADFGRILSAHDPRQIQLAVRFSW
jgi:Carboxypeptidase regulatory-like domain